MPATVERLPPDVQRTLALRLNQKDLGALCRTKKAFRSVCNDKNFWQYVLKRDFGTETSFDNPAREYHRLQRARAFERYMSPAAYKALDAATGPLYHAKAMAVLPALLRADDADLFQYLHEQDLRENDWFVTDDNYKLWLDRAAKENASGILAYLLGVYPPDEKGIVENSFGDVETNITRLLTEAIQACADKTTKLLLDRYARYVRLHLTPLILTAVDRGCLPIAFLLAEYLPEEEADSASRGFAQLVLRSKVPDSLLLAMLDKVSLDDVVPQLASVDRPAVLAAALARCPSELALDYARQAAKNRPENVNLLAHRQSATCSATTKKGLACKNPRKKGHATCSVHAHS